MILENINKEIFGYNSNELSEKSSKLIFNSCDMCGYVRLSSKQSSCNICISCTQSVRKYRDDIKYWWKIEIEPELLLSLYHGNFYSCSKIAKIFNCSRCTIDRYMIRFKIPARNTGESCKWNSNCGWSKGLTKETDERVAKIIKSREGFKHSTETKQKMSEFRQKNGTWNRGKTAESDSRIISGKMHPNFNKPLTIEQKSKLFTGLQKYMDNNGHPMNGKTHTNETKQKISIKRRGKNKGVNHHNWNGGITSLYKAIRELIERKNWRVSIFKRDNFTCRICGDNKGGNLVAHHIYPFANILEDFKIKSIEDAYNCDILFDINNGITLCERCHKKIHSKCGYK